MTRKQQAGWWLTLCILGPAAAGVAEPVTVWLTLDSQRIGPRVRVEGRFAGGDSLTVRPWMTEGDDRVEGSTFRLTTEHTPATARKAKLQRYRQSTLPKGLLIEIDTARQTSLGATTTLGDFEVSLNELQPGRGVELLGGRMRVERVPTVVPLTGNEAEEEYPSIATMPDGRTAVAYVAWDGKADRVFLRVGGQVRQLTDEPGDYLEPRCAVDRQGRLWVVWAAGREGRWDLWAWCEGKAVRLTSGRWNDFWPRVARDAGGRLWVAWQSVADDRHYEVMLGRLTSEGLAAVTNVSEHSADDWEPAICATPDGRLAVAWDTYRNGSFDIYLRQFRTGADGAVPLGPPQPVAASADREAHASVAADSQGRVWIAWDVSMADWGKHPKVGGTLHSYRHTDVACLEGGRLRRPARKFMDGLPEPFGKFVEYPQVAVDGQDRLWVIWRMSNEVRVAWHDPKLARAGQSYAIWNLLASQYDGGEWSRPVLIPLSNGRQDIRVDVARDADGQLRVVFAADGRTRRFPYMPVDYDVLETSLAGFGTGPKPLELVDADDLGRVTPAARDPELFALPRRWEVGGKTYCLAIGDTHRHTDISRCMNGYDGSLQDAYRYALDACGLDWLAISDHDQDLLKHRNDRIQRPRQDYDWWRSQKYCDLYTIPGRFLAVYGYEHGGSFRTRGGHKNVVLPRRGFPVIEADAPKELFAALEGSGAVAIPHQLADGGSRTDWQRWDGRFETVAEIFQTRGSYEYADCPRLARIFTPGHSLWDALARDVRIGVIASSDHGQTHQARACVYVEDPSGSGDLTAAAGFSRHGIIEALRARRSFGATTAVAFQVSLSGQPMGRELTVDEAPLIEARIVAPGDVRAMAVIRNNQFIYTTEPNARTASFQFRDLDLKPGQSAYYYVRALVGPQDIVWSSPAWLRRTK
ncbi:MAG TPA: hypothetical protein EYP56_17890 [Planctomycetaceae bacterium]|nr:hypothetical protein [Planctomycetaceae bacterium]HIQ22520.1 hypothetical protein [Planctomycetota bacterium]